jgi:hypothetical protein
MADQALASLVGFLLSVLCLRTLSSTGFALFTLLYGWYVAVLAGIRALTGEVVYARAGGRVAAARRASTAAGALAAVVGLAGAVGGLVLGVPALLALAVAVPALVGQSALRWAAIAGYRPVLAVRCDAVFLAGFAVVAATVLGTGSRPGLPVLLLLWGAVAAVAEVTVLGRHRELRPVPAAPVRWLRRNWRFGLPFLAESLSQSGLNAVTVAVLAAVAGLHQLALFMAAILLYAPVTLLLQAGSGMLVGELVRAGGRPAAFRRLVRGAGLGLAAAAAGWAGVLALVPAGVLGAVGGGTAVGARPLLATYGLTVALAGLLEVRQAAIRARQRPVLALWCRLGGALCIDAALVVGGCAGGALGAVRAGVLGTGVALAVSAAGCRECERPARRTVRRPSIGAPAQDPSPR